MHNWQIRSFRWFLGGYLHKPTRILTQTNTKEAKNTDTNQHKILTQTDTFQKLFSFNNSLN